ncbi:MAG: hypothetical protein MSC31_01750 [Solirubrobacteraceae bacterium MAG38_C4-C5]|nr:hypothetical protein [Candidatus Siliceabacter maunaloa]
MNHRLRTPATLATVAALALGAAACGDEEEEPEGGASAPQQQQQPPPEPEPEPVAEIMELEGQSTSVELDSGFVEALEMLEVTPGVLGDAALDEGTLTFPITAGNVRAFEPGSVSPYVQGEIMHSGSGLSLTAGDTVVELRDFVVDPGASVATADVFADDELAAEDAPVFFLDGSTLEPLRTTDDGRAVLEGTTVELKAEAAELLNETFGIEDLEEGLEVGTAKIIVTDEPQLPTG